MSAETDIDAMRPECAGLWQLVSEYADGCCSATDAAVVERHLAVCVDCSADLAFLRRSGDLLRGSPLAEPPPGLREAILAATVGQPTLADRARRAFGGLLAPAPVRAVALAGLAGAIALGILRPTGTRHTQLVDAPRAPDLAQTAPPPTVSVPLGPTGSLVSRAMVAMGARRTDGGPHQRRELTGRGTPVVAPPRIVRVASVTPIGPGRTSDSPQLGPPAVDAPPAKASASASDYVAAVGGRVEPVAEARSTLAEPETPVTASAEPGGDDAPRMMVASSAGAGQFAELADARQSGRRRPADSTHEPSVVVLAPRRQIRVDVIHGSF